MEMERERGERGPGEGKERRAGCKGKGETSGHPGRFFNQIITVIRCKANVKSPHEIPRRREKSMGIRNWQAISYSLSL